MIVKQFVILVLVFFFATLDIYFLLALIEFSEFNTKNKIFATQKNVKNCKLKM